VAGVESRDFDSPDETRTRVDIVRMGGTAAGRFAFEPGGDGRNVSSPSSERTAASFATSGSQSGRLAIEHEDGTEVEIGPGDAYVIEPGHGAWVVGDERFVGFEFESRSADEYAKG